MRTATIDYVESHLLTLLKAVEAGEEILITSQGRPVARIVPEIAKPATSVWSDLNEWVISGPAQPGPTVAQLREQDLL